MSVVYVPQVPHKLNRATGALEPLDMSPAREWGEVKVILTPGANPFTSMPAIIDDLHAALQDITPNDFIILVGNPAIMGAMAAIAAEYTEGKLRVLQWHKYQNRYNEIKFNVS